MSSETVTVAVFNGNVLFAIDLDTSFRDLVAMCREALKDAELTEENFGEYFFFRTEGALIDDRGFFIDVFTLEKMGVKDGQLLELCYVP